MTYRGSTAGTTLANPPLELFAVVGGKIQYPGVLWTSTTMAVGGKVWFYSSTHQGSDVKGAGFITDGAQLGMRPGDFMFGVALGPVAGGLIASTDYHAYYGILNSTESTLSTGAYNLSSNVSTARH